MHLAVSRSPVERVCLRHSVSHTDAPADLRGPHSVRICTFLPVKQVN